MIAAISITHKTANLDIRQSFSIAKAETKPLADRILYETEITELVILSTCNRTEIYFYHDKTCTSKSLKQVIQIMHSFKDVKSDFSMYFKTFKGKDAVKHLFEVTAGVDSMVVGEDQIVKQVKEAYVNCTDLAITDAVLMRLFQKSFETGKRVRTETNIQKGATSVSYVAVQMCAKAMQDISNKKVLLLGAGDTGKDVLSHLKKLGNQNFILANRTLETARNLASTLGGEYIPFEEYKNHLPHCDIIITATNAGKELIKHTDVEQYTHKREAHQMFIDLSVPRNIDASINKLKNATVYGVDDLQQTLNGKQEIRISSMQDADNIINGMVDDFYDWLDSRALRPIIKTITSSMQEVNKTELKQWNKCLSNQEMQMVEEYGNKLSQKYIRSFIKNLKELAAQKHSINDLHLIEEMFNME